MIYLNMADQHKIQTCLHYSIFHCSTNHIYIFKCDFIQRETLKQLSFIVLFNS